MFWSGNYIAVRELKFLLKEENVTLTQVLEADDILQECKADNKALIQFLTKPEVLAELITLITEEPPKNVEIATQYRHANIACEVLTSQLSMLSDRLSLDAVQMNRLCDFINKDPPLNPLLASYFSKTVEMLLERSPKQDWYLYHIVCLRVLDFFKSRRDFLPNLLRHMSTSAIADTFKCFIRLDDLFKKTVMEWLDEHQFLDSLIQIICGTYVPEEYQPPVVARPAEQPEKGQQEPSEKAQTNHHETKEGENVAEGDEGTRKSDGSPPEAPSEAGAAAAEAERAARAARVAAVASANAAALLCDLITNGCSGDCSTRSRGGGSLSGRLRSEGAVRALLQGMFTSGPRARPHALVNGCLVLRALLDAPDPSAPEEGAEPGAGGAERGAVELAVAPHLPLLHHALLQPAEPQEGAGDGRRVGLARLQVATLLARLALSEVEEVAGTMLTLGTPGVLVDMFFAFADNNFLHAQVFSLVRHGLHNPAYRSQYARHILEECNLLSRLMDLYEENKHKKEGCPRAASMGHAVALLALLAREGRAEGPAAWLAFQDQELAPLLQRHYTPLGGFYPSENIYEAENMADTLAANYDFNDMAATATMDEMTHDVNADDSNEVCGAGGVSTESADFIADGLGIDDEDKAAEAENSFLELASRKFDDDMWESMSAGELRDFQSGLAGACEALSQFSLWGAEETESGEAAGEGEGEGEGAGGGEGEGEAEGEGWAQFAADAFAQPPIDPFAPSPGPAAAAGPGAPVAPVAPVAPTDPADPAVPSGPAGAKASEQPFADDDFDQSQEFTPFWSYTDQGDRNNAPGPEEHSSAELANNLLTAMSGMSADAIANLVNANLEPPSAEATFPTDNRPSEGPGEVAAQESGQR